MRIQDVPTDLHEVLLVDLLSLQIADSDIIRRRFEALGAKLEGDVQLLAFKQTGMTGGAIPKATRQDLYQTLFLYLHYMKDVNRVCEELHIHRSAIFYRLNKLKNEYGLDLDNGDVFMQLMFSYKILQYYESNGYYRKEVSDTILD